MLPRGSRQRRHGRVEGQLRRASRVHAAEQRVDQPVDDLRAEPGSDVLRDRHVAVPGRRRQIEVTRGAGDSGIGHHAGPGQVVQVGRHAHELPTGQRPQRAERPDRRGGGSWRDALVGQPDLGDEAGTLGAGDEERLRSLVDRDPGHLGYGQLAAQPRRPLEHRHPDRLVSQVERCRQPGDPAAHDHHMRPRSRRVHASQPGRHHPMPGPQALKVRSSRGAGETGRDEGLRRSILCATGVANFVAREEFGWGRGPGLVTRRGRVGRGFAGPLSRRGCGRWWSRPGAAPGPSPSGGSRPGGGRSTGARSRPGWSARRSPGA